MWGPRQGAGPTSPWGLGEHAVSALKLDAKCLLSLPFLFHAITSQVVPGVTYAPSLT